MLWTVNPVERARGEFSDGVNDPVDRIGVRGNAAYPNEIANSNLYDKFSDNCSTRQPKQNYIEI